MSNFISTRNVCKVAAFACALVMWCCGAQHAVAQARQAYEYDPYRVVIWVAIEPLPLLPAAASPLAQRLAAQADQVFGATWQVQGEAAPTPLVRLIASGSAPTWDDIGAAMVKQDVDKLMLVAIQATEGGGVRASVREFDCRARSAGEAITREAAQPQNIDNAALSAIVAAFSPVVRIEGLADNQLQTRLRAGGLIDAAAESPAALQPGELLVPVVRRNDRSGEPRGASGIQRVPHTYLQVASSEGFDVACSLHSGLRGAIPPKGNRVERFALRVRPQREATRLTLRARDSSPAELVDYEVLARLPGEKTEPAPLGITDLRGEVLIARNEHPLLMVYVRHGEQMLARIPVVPGLLTEQTITLSSDDQRMLAESYFVAMQSTLMDLVARREVLAARIRLRIEQDDLAGAGDLLTELRAMTSRADLLKQLETQQLTYKGTDRALQIKVDKMFEELRKLLGKHLDPKLIDDLSAEVGTPKKV